MIAGRESTPKVKLGLASETGSEETRSMKRFLVTLLLLVVIGAAVAKIFLFELPGVVGNDMAPALQPGDRLLAYRQGREPGRGDLVLLEHPREANRLLLRRVIALPGEHFAFKKETPWIEGSPAARRVIREIALRDEGRSRKLLLVEEELRGTRYLVLKDPARRSHDEQEVRLERAYYVLADNRNHGTDSRTFGPVPAEKIRARITHRLSAGEPGSLVGQPAREGWKRLP